MNKHILIVIILFGGIATSTATQATLIQLLRDDLQMYTQVYSSGNPETIVSQTSFSGSLFDNSHSSISSSGAITCLSPTATSDHQWAKAETESSLTDPYFHATVSSGWNHVCDTTNTWGNMASIQISLEFAVIPEGENYVFMYVEEFLSSYSLFNMTLGTQMTPGHSGGPYFNLLDNHTYILNIDLTRAANQASLPYGYNDDYAFMYYPHFYAIFSNTRISPVPEPRAFMLFSLSTVGLLFVNLIGSRKMVKGSG